MSEQINFNKLIQYLSAIALALFFLIYLPWTKLSYFSATMDPLLLWVYYFTLVLGLMFPLYYAIEQENMSWYVLGLSILISSVIWAAVEPAQVLAAVMTLFVGLLFFIGPLIEPRMQNWDLIKNLLHILKGLFMIMAAGFYANWNLDALVGLNSWNHVMPQLIFMGGGIAVAFAFVLLAYGLFNILSKQIGSKIGGWFGDLAKIFYMLMVLIFLLGITYNVAGYIVTVLITYPWPTLPSLAPTFPTSIEFFRNMAGVGIGNLGAILLIILFIYGMGKIAKKYE
ncbi:MAG: hypothetical protein JW779_01480 [Candidatus Thorarchaeota archaeon]|nr:hypothetical protein [Candidatus Thorarchaeota archaeon]